MTEEKAVPVPDPIVLNILGGAMGKSGEELEALSRLDYLAGAPFGSTNPKERVALLDREGLAKAILGDAVTTAYDL